MSNIECRISSVECRSEEEGAAGRGVFDGGTLIDADRR
jgi:hypothetical protein